MVTNEYKPYAHTSRVKTTEESYALGMKYTDQPLMEGNCKTLVNFDFKNAGESLISRAALNVEKYYTECNPTGFIDVVTSDPVKNPSKVMSYMTHHRADNTDYFFVGVDQDVLTDETDTEIHDVNRLGVVSSNKTRSQMIADVTEPPYPYTESADELLPSVPQYGYTVNEMFFMDAGGFHANVYIKNGMKMFSNKFVFFGRAKFQDQEHVTSMGFFVLDLSKLSSDGATPGVESLKIMYPKEVTAKEAVTWGYNMLLKTPFTFANSIGTSVNLQGMLPYDAAGNLVMNFKLNQDLNWKCFYSAPAGTYTVTWEWKSLDSTVWTAIKTATTTAPNVCQASFAPPTKQFIMRVTFVKDAVSTVLAVGFDLDSPKSTIQPIDYTLTTAKGMAYWKQHMVLYNVAEDPTMLFLSDVDDPSYFPYPNNIHSFAEPIVYATEFLDDLLVFTETQVHLMTMNPDGISWTVKTIQKNLRIAPEDVGLIQVVKNMVFFKSGLYFYMVVPKASSLTGELQIAPVSKPIVPFLDNTLENLQQVYIDTYGVPFTTEAVQPYLWGTYNFLDYEDIHNIYYYNLPNKLINFDLVYNTFQRAWRILIFESASKLYSLYADATKRGTFVQISSVNQNLLIYDPYVPTHVVKDVTSHILQVMHWDASTAVDSYIPNDVTFKVITTDATPTTVTNLPTFFTTNGKIKNAQYLNSGLRDHATTVKKRYRELQFNLVNHSKKNLHFYLGFKIDGRDRKDAYETAITRDVTDPQSPNYGVLTLSRSLVPNIHLAGETILTADGGTDLTGWLLDQSVMPSVALWRTRVPISGKGFSPSLTLGSDSEELFELYKITWVYRNMSAR